MQAEMRDLFNAIDTDGSGTITHEEMMQVTHDDTLTPCWIEPVSNLLTLQT